MKIIIIGAGEIGYNIAKDLILEKRDVTLIEKNADRIAFIKELGEEINVINGSGNNPEVLIKAGITSADLLVAVANSDETNISACYLASNLAPKVRKIARIRGINTQLYDQIVKGNPPIIDAIINPEELCAIKIANLIKYVGIYDMNWLFNKKAALLGITINEENRLIGHTLADLGKIREEIKMKALIAAIIRNKEAFIPSGEDVIEKGDILYIATITEEIKRVSEFFINQTPQDIKFVTIYGGSNIGYNIAQQLKNENLTVKIIEPETSRATVLSQKLSKALTLKGDLFDKIIFEDEKIADSDVFVAATDDQESNIITTLYMKSQGVNQGVTVLHKRDYAPLVKNLGIDVTVIPQQVAVGKILENIRKGHIISVVLLNQNDIEVEEFQAIEGTKLVKKPIKDLKLPKGVLVIAVEKISGEMKIPYGDTIINPGDKVAIIAQKSKVPNIQKFITS